MTAPDLNAFVDPNLVRDLIAWAMREDMGPDRLDITSELLVPADARATARMRARRGGRLAGAALLGQIAAAYDPAITVQTLKTDGANLERGDVVTTFTGPLRSILAMERVALNFVTHLSGIATLTARYVAAVEGTAAGIYDTRKTIPGFRGLAKYAVVCGGGHSHRMGLYDAVLVKDNHIADIPLEQLADVVTRLIEDARRRNPAPNFIEIEVDRLDQLERVLPCSPDIVLLDNMDVPQLREAVAMRNRLAPKVKLESSGGVTLETVRAIAETGVDRIAIGALTHSAPALDLGLDIEEA